MVESKNMPGARFFKPIPEKNSSRAVISPIEIRGDVFRALAIAIMDNLKGGVSLPEMALKKIFQRFVDYFPAAKKTLTIDQETLGYLAFALRQIAVDEALANPADYQELFFGLDSEVEINSLRQVDTPLGPCVVAAVARALNITVTLSFKRAAEELRARQVLNKIDSSHFAITLQVQDGVYFPCVKNQTYFAAIGQLSTTPVKFLMPSNSGTIEDALNIISHDNEILWKRYQEYRNRLMSTANENALSFRDLAQLYVKDAFLPDESSRRLIASLEKQRAVPIVKGERDSLEQSRRKMLIDAFASGLSTGAIDEDELFDAMESSYTRTSKVGSQM